MYKLKQLLVSLKWMGQVVVVVDCLHIWEGETLLQNHSQKQKLGLGTPAILALWRLRPEQSKFKARLGYK